MPIDPERRCPCHGEPMLVHGQHWRCVIRRRASSLVARRRYAKTAKGRANTRARNARRVFVGRTYRGRAQTTEQAAGINAHLRRRLDEFKQSRRTADEASAVD